MYFYPFTTGTGFKLHYLKSFYLNYIMKTATIILSLLLIGSNGLLAQKSKKVKDPNYESMRGKVRTYTTTTYASSSADPGGPPEISEDSIKARLKYDLNEMGELSSEKVLAGENQNYWTRRTYNQRGQLLAVRAYDTADQTLWFTKYTYDKKDRPKVMKSFRGDSSFVGQTLYEYDGKGNLIEENVYEGEVVKNKIKYTYYNKNLRDKTVYYWDPNDKYYKIDNKYVYGYDKDGNIISLKTHKGDSYTYKYEFDSKGNWIRKTVSNQGQPTQVIVRKIEYR